MDEIDRFANDDVNILIIGNKQDAEAKRKVTYDDGAKLANQYKVSFIEASAKSGFNVNEAFMMITKQIYGKLNKGGKSDIDGKAEGDTTVLKLTLNNKTQCC